MQSQAGAFIPIKRSRNIIESMFLNCWHDCVNDFHPIDRRMKILEEADVEGMSTENIRFLINELLRRMKKNAVYLEIGVYRGCSLLSAALFNSTKKCIGIDNFSQFDHFSIIKELTGCDPHEKKNNLSILKENVKKFQYPNNIQVLKADYKIAIKRLFVDDPELKVDFFFYDGEHTYKSQITAMKMAERYLSEKCIILVDDTNIPEIRRANRDFLRRNPDFKLIKSIRTPRNAFGTWWNGIEIIARGYR